MTTNNPRIATRTLAVLVGAALIVSACGDDTAVQELDAGGLIEMAEIDQQADDPAPDPEAGAESPAVGQVSEWDDVDSAVVRIETTGGILDPDAFDFDTPFAGSGSGFFISRDGLLVTNNHVVVGAATVEVHVAGEASPRNGRVVAASECSDLAVVEVGGADVPFLDWASRSAEVPDDIFAVGFPLGDPEVTVTEGVVSKARAAGESDFASVDNAIEHTAFTTPGNSGGPIVDPGGRVVGVNYAGNDAGQNFAISAAEAKAIITELVAGNDVEWLGLNSVAIQGAGILVLAVETDSPAARAGVRAGDLIVELEDLPVGVDGTKAGYCDVLRSRAADEPLRVEVIHLDNTESAFVIERG
ncbi:MAG: trypsin-like peptidase domain-containing protein [Acidimicrobiales bacterium]